MPTAYVASVCAVSRSRTMATLGTELLERRLRRAFSSLAGGLLLLATAVVVGVAWHQTEEAISEARSAHHTLHRERVRREVERAAAFLRPVLAADVPEAERERVIDTIRHIRFGNDDHLFLIHWEGDGRRVLAGSYPPTQRLGPSDTESHTRHSEFRELARRGGGFVAYEFGPDRPANERTKLSYIAPLLPDEHVLGAGVYVPDIARQVEAIRAEHMARLWRMVLGLGLVGLLALLVSLWFVRRTVDRLAAALQRFNAFFDDAAVGLAEIDVDKVEYEELRHAARAANTMLERRVAAEDKARHAERMQATAVFASGVAHDFNNYITVIGVHAEGLTAHEEAGVAERGRLIAQAAERGKELTARLLHVAGAQESVAENNSVHHVIGALEPLLRPLLGESVTLRTELGATRDTVRVSESELVDALMNLGTNARDAMGERGTLTIRTRDGTAEDTVVVTVEDDGEGMPAGVAARALDAFFTTKPKGKGTGLGLAQVNRFVSSMGGRVDISSTPGEGTRVELHLPLADA